MFVLPALIFPFFLGLALYRLIQIPRKLREGRLQLPGYRWWAAAAGACLALLCCTAALGTALLRVVVLAEDRLPAYLSLLLYPTACPVVYFAAAWVFYYGLK